MKFVQSHIECEAEIKPALNKMVKEFIKKEREVLYKKVKRSFKVETNEQAKELYNLQRVSLLSNLKRIEGFEVINEVRTDKKERLYVEIHTTIGIIYFTVFHKTLKIKMNV